MLNPEDLALFGRFPGHELSLADCEAIVINHWQPKERFREPELMGKKWWDYRSMHSVHATYLFSHLLTLEVRRIIRAHINPAPPQVRPDGSTIDWNPIKAGDVFMPPARAQSVAFWRRKILGLVRARQSADEFGIPYPLFIAEGLKHFYFGGGTYVLARAATKMPEPNLLYGDECLGRIQSAWLEQIKSKVQHAVHPRFQIVNRDAHQDHSAHTDWLMQQLKLRAVREYAAANLVKQGLMGTEDALPLIKDRNLFNKLLGVPLPACAISQ